MRDGIRVKLLQRAAGWLVQRGWGVLQDCCRSLSVQVVGRADKQYVVVEEQA